MQTTTVGLESRLAATLYLPYARGAALPGLVVGHGAGSCRGRHELFCREAVSHGFAVLALDFRGHGDSQGVADGPLEEDIAVAARYLRAHPAVDASRLCYRGSSMGGFYGLKAATTGDFAAVTLLCPASEQIMLETLNALPLVADDTEAPTAAAPEMSSAADRSAPAARWDVPATRAYFLQQRSLAIAAVVTCPVLLIHARGDDVMPLAHSLALAEHLAGDATLVAPGGGSHTSAQHDPALHRLTARWLLASF